MPDRPGDTTGPPARGRAQADRELRTAVLVAIPVLVLGQLALLAGWWPVAAVLALGGTFTAFLLARRWSGMADEP